MSTVQAFNELMKNFLAELGATFPEQKSIQLYVAGFDTLVSANSRKPVELFMAALGPHADMVMARNPSLFDQPIDLGGSLDLKEIWSQEDLSDTSRDALWQYIHTLFLLGSTIQHMPADMLQSIEAVAKDCASKIESGQQMDMSTMAAAMMQSMSTMMGRDEGAGNGRITGK